MMLKLQTSIYRHLINRQQLMLVLIRQLVQLLLLFWMEVESSDYDGSITSYSWKQIGGPVVMLNDANTATASFTSPNISTSTVLVFELTVKDSKNASGISTVKITVKPSIILL